MKARFFFLLNFLVTGVVFASHPVHVSIVNLDFFADSNKINYSICLYYDDFQSLINHKYNTMLDFSHQNRMTSREQQSILNYLNSSFIIRNPQNKALDSEFLNWKFEDNMVWFFFCVKDYPAADRFIIENRLLLDLFMDQKNLLIVNCGEIQEGYEFNKRNTTFTVKDIR